MDIPTVQVTERAKKSFPGAAIGSAVQTGLGFFGNLIRQKHEERMAQEQRNWNLEQWHRQNKYNSPEAQMERLKAAGLNPHLLYGQGVKGATGQADAVPGYDQPGSVDLSSGIAPFSQYQSFKNQQISNDLRIATQRYMESKEDNNILKYNADAMELEARGLNMDLKGDYWRAGKYDTMMQARTDALYSKDLGAKLNYEMAFLSKDDKLDYIRENATRMYYEGLSAKAQWMIKQQFLKAGPYAAREATINMLMGSGISYDRARMMAPSIVSLVQDPLKVVKPSIGAFKKSGTKLKSFNQSKRPQGGGLPYHY